MYGLQPAAGHGSGRLPAEERSALSKCIEVSLVLSAVLGFVFLGMWARDYVAISAHPECAAISNCTTCAQAPGCGWCSASGDGECSATCHTEIGECDAGYDDARRSGGGFYWWPLFWVFWLCPCGYYGYGYGYGYYGRYGRNDDLAAQEDQQGLVQGQQGSSATRV